MEAAMRKFCLVAAISTIATLVTTGASHAQYNAPWCAVQSLGQGSMVERCVFWDFETCRREVVAGNRGYCNQNPRFAGYVAATPPKRKVRRKHARR
jgi:hypothetical protein